MKKFLLFAAVIIPFLTFSNEEFQFEIKGATTDFENHEVLPFINIFLISDNDTISKTQSDFDGNYVLRFPKYDTYDIHIKSIGYKPQIHQSIVFDQIFFEQLEPILQFKLLSTCIQSKPYFHSPCNCIKKQNSELASELRGRILDKIKGEPLPFVNIILEKNGVQIAGGQTDFDGLYVIKPIPEGTYTVKISDYGYKEMAFKDITIRAKTAHFVDFKLDSKIEQIESQTEINPYKSKLIDFSPTGEIKGKVMDSETNEPVPFAGVRAEINGVQISEGLTDFDGNFRLIKLPPGKYTIKIQNVGYKKSTFSGIRLENEETFSTNLKIKPAPVSITYCGGYYVKPEVEPEPITDLFTEQDSLNTQDDKLLLNSNLSSKVGMTRFTAYPNPTSGELQMANLSGIDEVNLIRIDGTIIQSIKTGLMTFKTIDMSFLTPGVYFLQYIVEDKLQSHRIIKF